MGQLSEYFMNGATFAEATSLYTDSTLSVHAADGFYSKDGISRQLSGGVLGDEQPCADCALDCGGDFVTILDGGVGTWLTTFSASDAVGAVLVEILVGSEAVGFKAEYNSTTYNSICSVTEGLLESSNATRPTYIGESSAAFGPVSFSGPVYDYLNGEHIQIGTQNHVQLAGDDQRTTANPGTCYILVPKFTTTAEPIVVTSEAFNNGETNFAIKANCPQLLTKFAVSSISSLGTVGDACGMTVDGEKYHFPITGIASPLPNGLGTIGLHDFVANDSTGALPLSDGFYKISGQNVIEVEGGIVINITSCVS